MKKVFQVFEYYSFFECSESGGFTLSCLQNLLDSFLDKDLDFLSKPTSFLFSDPDDAVSYCNNRNTKSSDLPGFVGLHFVIFRYFHFIDVNIL